MENTVRIILENTNVCSPGQTVSGRVECFFNKEKKIRAIRIKFKGRARTKFSSGGKNSTTYTAEQIYFNEEYNLVSGGDDFFLDAGKHTYPFSYILPQSLPSPFEGLYGKIRYSIKATVDRPWKFDYEHKLALYVVSPLNLNLLPRLEQPVATSVDKEVSYGCCRTGPLIFNIYLPATGFVAGQLMNIHACIKNLSNVTVEHVEFRIIQVTEFIAHTPSTRQNSEEFSIIQYQADPNVGTHAEKEWVTSLTIPSYNYLNLTPCRIINITYRLEAEVVLPLPHINLKTAFPITLGSVPLTGENTQLLDAPPSYSNATAPVQGSDSTPASVGTEPLLAGSTTAPLGLAPYAVEDKFSI